MRFKLATVWGKKVRVYNAQSNKLATVKKVRIVSLHFAILCLAIIFFSFYSMAEAYQSKILLLIWRVLSMLGDTMFEGEEKLKSWLDCVICWLWLACRVYVYNGTNIVCTWLCVHFECRLMCVGKKKKKTVYNNDLYNLVCQSQLEFYAPWLLFLVSIYRSIFLGIQLWRSFNPHSRSAK